MTDPSPPETSLPIYTAAPLPPGWTEHRAPTGQFYYYHAASGESTYVRPSIQVPATKEEEPGQDGVNGTGGSESQKATSGTSTNKKKKKEKPKTKETISGTTWMKVTTTAGNTFYTNVETKVSSWTVPEEIKEQLKMHEETQAREAESFMLADRRAFEAQQRRLVQLEVQKVRAEVEAETLRLKNLKRKPDQHDLSPTPSHPTPAENLRESKLPKLASIPPAAENDHDEEWQRQIAEEMAQEAAQDSQTSPPPVQEQPKRTSSPSTIQNNPPPAGLSLEELKATFKAMLLEKSIDPMAPWDNELPKFVTDARYLALPSMKERRDLFDEFCKEKIRQQRAAKQAAPKADPPQAYRSLLIESVRSTRTLWEEFKNQHKKDGRFRNFGRDDREREKVFKGWLKELGEQKRQQLMKAEEEFQELLGEKADPTGKEEYKEFKERVHKDPRFLAITSNSSKESMWKKWQTRSHSVENDAHKSKKELEPANLTTATHATESDKSKEEETKRWKQEASLKAREEQVREMQKKVEKASAQNKQLAGREEAEREFQSFLIDQVREHDVDWDDVLTRLRRDERFEVVRSLPDDSLQQIFRKHTEGIYSKLVRNLEKYFEESEAEPLRGTFEEVWGKLMGVLGRAPELESESEGLGKKEESESDSGRMQLKETYEGCIRAGGDGRRRGRRRPSWGCSERAPLWSSGVA
ncbi:hypothetical protein VP01_764g7 [Puccinia sorghi]|uniref:Transcription elongation regulator 1 n=1 Tax=Puccinia sorghi TaxID=27349 RepID=A0A0L6UBU3_9BASI|nr:hypothetical protein VP01_764g7 [Puccinia sorghi]